MTNIRIVIADDQTLLRDGLQTIINLEDDMEVVASVDNGNAAIEAVRRHRPDLVLMDVRMPGLDGIEATRRLTEEFPGLIVVVLTTFLEDQYIVDSMANGASGFLLKDMPGDKILQSIRDAAEGQMMLPSSVAARLASRISMLSAGHKRFRPAGQAHKHRIAFTERERQIGRLLMESKSNKEIARALFLSEGTAKNYISVIYHKIGVSDRLMAIRRLAELFAEE